MKRIYLIGGTNGKADPTDYVIEYEHNGFRIEIKELVDGSYRWYKVDGHEYNTLKEAREYIERKG